MDVIREPTKRRWSTKRRNFVVGVGVLAVAFFLWGLRPALPSVAADSVAIDTARRGDMLLKVSGPGTLVPLETRLIPSILPKAQVERLLIQPGEAVKADAVLMRLSNPLIIQQYDEAKLRLEVANAELQALKNKLGDDLLSQESRFAAARASYESAKLQAEREGQLQGSEHVVPEVQYKKSLLMEQQYKTQLDVETKRLNALPQLNWSQLRAKEAQLSMLQRELDLAKKLADSLQVQAGIDGVVQEIRVKEGQGVDQGEILAVVARQDRLKAEIRIIESQARDVVVGQKVVIDTGNSSQIGTVTRIDPSVINGTVIVDAAFSGDPPKGARVNLRLNATIEIDNLKNVLYIGKPAQMQENAPIKLYKIGTDGVATLTTVRLGRMSANTVEVVGGLAEGDRIVLSDAAQVSKSDQFKLN